MKTTLYSLLAAAACGMALGQTAYTTPVGYTTQTAVAGQYNLLGLTVQNPVVAAGVFETVVGMALTDTDVNFTTLPLTAGATYVLEIGTTGIVQEVVSWSASTLTTPQNISASVTPGVTTYKLRKAATIASIFGAANEVGLKPGTSTTADVIWIPNAANGFDQFYRASAAPPFTTAGWKKVGGGNTDYANAPIVYADSFLLQRRDVTPLTLVTSGEVKLTNSATVLATGVFNYIGGIYPSGTTFANSGLAATVLAGSSTTADIVLVPNGLGGYVNYYLAVAAPPFTTAGWKRVGGGNTDQATVALTAGMIVQRKGPTATLTLTPPSTYPAP